MTDAEKELRRLAEGMQRVQRTRGIIHTGLPEVRDYIAATTPDAVLALLDRIEALEAFDKESTLRMQWDKAQGDLITDYPGSKLDARLPHNAFNYGAPVGCDQSLLKELEAMGYDIATLRFSIKKKFGDAP